jgi:cytochrome c-type biogenesis protein CcmH/NrfF
MTDPNYSIVIPSEVRDLLFRGRRAKLFMGLITLLAFASSPVLIAQAPYSARAKEIGMHLKCMCKGCDMSAGGCAHPGGSFSGPCDTAKAELQQVDAMLAKGMTQQQIVDAFVQQYGTIVYVEPPKHGFGLVAWLMPIVYTIVGLALVIFIVRKWYFNKPAMPAVTPPVGATSEALQRARAQADRETED